MIDQNHNQKTSPGYKESRKNQTTAQACITERGLESKVFINSEGKHVSDTIRILLPVQNCREHTINII
jgi:hypothetical protein